HPMLRNLQRIHFLEAESVEGDSVQFVVRVEESQHVALGPNDLVQPLHHGAQQHRVQILQNVPNQDTIELGIRVIQGLLQEVLDASGVGMVHRVGDAKGVVED